MELMANKCQFFIGYEKKSLGTMIEQQGNNYWNKLQKSIK